MGPKEDPAAFWNNIHLKPHTRWLLRICAGCVLVLCRFVGFSGAFHKKFGACGGLWGCNCSSACVLRRIISLHKKSAKQYRSAKSGRGGCWCPCLCASNRYWVVPLHREMTGDECLRLQGFDPAALRGLTNSEKRRRAGNSMTVPLVAAVLRGLGI